MSTEQSGGSLWPTSGLVLAALAILGAGVAESRLRTSRPDVPVESDDEEGAGQHIRARLWQDPLAAVRAHLDGDSHGGEGAAVAAPEPAHTHDFAARAEAGAEAGAAQNASFETSNHHPGVEPLRVHPHSTASLRLQLQERAHQVDSLDVESPLGLRRHPTSDDSRANAPEGRDSADESSPAATSTTESLDYGAPLLIAALVPGSNFVEDSETRRRARFAVVSGLLAEDFLPESAGFLGVAEHTFETDLTTGPSSISIPYEWFRHDRETRARKPAEVEANSPPAGRSDEPEGGKLVDAAPRLPRDVLVLWIDESALPQSGPLAGVLGIFGSLTHLEPNPHGHRSPVESVLAIEAAMDRARHDPAPFRRLIPNRRVILGPSNSDLLKTMVGEAEFLDHALQDAARLACISAGLAPSDGVEFADPCSLRMASETKFFSTRASAPEHSILEGLAGRYDSIAKVFEKRLDIEFHRTICSDKHLGRELIAEFARRDFGNDGFDSSDVVVLLTESDTLYGRNFAGLLKSAFRRHAQRTGTGMPNIRPFSYFRGLDGHVANAAQQGGLHEDVGQSFGRVQYDYARNLARRLKSLEQELHREREGSIVAIGVLGSDLYDKQILLQAIESRFPTVLRFSTDLDARLLHPEQYPWSRNLLIASGHGFELNSDLQGSTPPFRDGYQTSTYLATRLAIPGHAIRFEEEQRGGPQATLDERLLTPRLFEVGRGGAYDLSPTLEGYSLHPPRSQTLPHIGTLILILVIGGTLVLLLWPMMASIAYGLGGLWREGLVSETDPGRTTLSAEEEQRRRRLRWGASTLLVLAVLYLMYSIDREDSRGVGEPFELMEGISVWPTIFTRTLAIVLSGLLLRRSHVLMTRNKRKIARRFKLPEPSPGWAPGTPPTFTIRGWSSRNKKRYDHEDGGRRLNPAGRLWGEYLALSAPLRRGARIVLNVVLAYLVYLLFTRAFGSSPSPARGSIALGLDAVTRHMAFLAMATLVFFVADATRLGEVLIRSLSIQRTEWPTGAWCPFGRRDERLGATGEMSVVRDVQLIARHSEALGKLLIYPFVVLMLLILARNDFFDHWHWGLRDTLSYALLAGYALASTVLLRRSSEEARGRALKFLRARLMRAEGEVEEEEATVQAPGAPKASEATKPQPVAKTPFSTRQLELLIEDVRGMARGAFAPLSEHPIFRAAVLPFTGLGLTSLLDLMATLNA